jgi:hypothetical protein
MQIINADPRDRRGSKQRQAMLSVLRGLGAGDDLDALIVKTQKDYDDAQAALATLTVQTARDSRGRAYFTADTLLLTDLPSAAAWHSSDAESVNVENVIPAIFGAINGGAARYLDLVDKSDIAANERAAGWIIGRLFDKYGADQVFRSINAGEDSREAFKGAVRWWTNNGAGDSIERLGEVALNRDGAAWGDSWAKKHGHQVGAAIRWLKAATKAREDAIKDATTQVSIAKSALDAALAAKGYVPKDDGSAPVICADGYKLDPLTNKCVEEEKSVLPWVLGGAAVLGLVLFLRRR